MSEKNFVTDENGNRAESWYFGTEEKARAALETLKDCKNCINCWGCSGCSDCSGCSGCSDCSGCWGCSDCSDCSGCWGCSDCSGCSRCSRCSGCSRVRDIAEEPAVVGPFRSDRYQFVITKEGGVRAGCRVFESFTEAREHWTKTRGGTPLGAETMRILDWCEAEYNARKA